MPATDDHAKIQADFKEAVNMTAAALEKYLGTEESKEVGWKGESGLITDVVNRLEGDITEVDAYVCGPPPMVEATIALLEAKGVPEAHIYYDKFTTTADE